MLAAKLGLLFDRAVDRTVLVVGNVKMLVVLFGSCLDLSVVSFAPNLNRLDVLAVLVVAASALVVR